MVKSPQPLTPFEKRKNNWGKRHERLVNNVWFETFGNNLIGGSIVGDGGG